MADPLDEQELHDYDFSNRDPLIFEPSSPPPSSGKTFTTKLRSISRYVNSSRLLQLTRRYTQFFTKRIAGSTKKEMIYRICLITLVCTIITISTTSSGQQKGMQIYYSNFHKLRPVSSIKDLNNVDISKMLRFKKWTSSPMTEETFNQKYETEELVAYAANLDLKRLNKQNSKKGKVEDKFANMRHNQNYESLVTCNELRYNTSLESSVEKRIIDDDLIQMRRDILARKDQLSKAITSTRHKDLPESEIIEKYWTRFGAAPLWMEQEQCYVVYSRVSYSEHGHKVVSKISLIRAQAFDKDWNEIIGKRIPFNDVAIPKDIEAELKKLDEELGLNTCDHLIDDPVALDDCIVDAAKNKLAAEKKKANILSKYYMTYPTILDIPFDSSKLMSGPEDPHVIMRKTTTVEEPIVFFNMQEKENHRQMYGFFPHRKNDPMIKFNLEGRKLNDVEKNWSPFFRQNIEFRTFSRGTIQFIYSYAPLEIMRCSLDDGQCKMVFEATTNGVQDSSKFGNMRGSSQYLPLPNVFPAVKDKQIWVGFPKVHLGYCGCGTSFYRPMLSILVESRGVYYLSATIPAIDFNIDVLNWDEKTTNCVAENVLNLNSIAFWDVVSQDPETKKIEDYMIVSVSEADVLTKIVTIKGIMNFVMGVYDNKPMKESLDLNADTRVIIEKTTRCIIDETYDECKASLRKVSPGQGQLRW